MGLVVKVLVVAVVFAGGFYLSVYSGLGESLFHWMNGSTPPA